MSKLAELTDWLSPLDQQYWFDKFSSSSGLDFKKFQEFLDDCLYTYFARLPSSWERKDSNGYIRGYDREQEKQLFKIFDTNGDQTIDRDEFSFMCKSWLTKIFRRACALVIVDVQNDFIDGSLALINGPAGQDGADVVPVINEILNTCSFDAVVYTQDWHPIDHIGFHENLHLRKYTIKKSDKQYDKLDKVNEANEPSRSRFKLKKLNTNVKLFDTVLFEDGKVEQKLWPVHCVQNSWGAELHPKLNILPNSIRIFKGTLSNIDAYSAFWDNMCLNETGLRQELQSRKIDDVFFCGLALDYCVAASALDSNQIGFTTFIIEDACRGIDNVEMDRRKRNMLDKGVLLIKSDSINSYLLQVARGDSLEIISNGRSNINNSTGDGEIKPCTLNKGLDRSWYMDVCVKKALKLVA